MSYYEYETFRKACCEKRNEVILIQPVPKTAERDFNLKNRKEVLDFIAFMINEKTEKWIIKSLHLSEESNPAMYLAIQKAGLIDLGGE